MSGHRYMEGMARQSLIRSWMMAPGTWRLRPRTEASYAKPSLWARSRAVFRRFGLKVEASVSPTRATKRLEADLMRRLGPQLEQIAKSASPRTQVRRHQQR